MVAANIGMVKLAVLGLSVLFATALLWRTTATIQVDVLAARTVLESAEAGAIVWAFLLLLVFLIPLVGCWFVVGSALIGRNAPLQHLTHEQRLRSLHHLLPSMM